MDSADPIVIMQQDLARALERPPDVRRWAMIVDTRKCVGCRSCTVGCIAENALPRGLSYRPVFEEESGRFPKVTRRFIPRPCMHCDSPACTNVCPKPGKATYKSREGLSAGMVVIDYTECIRCGKCVRSCPYKARGEDRGLFWADGAPFVPEIEKRAAPDYGKQWPRDGKAIPPGTVRKCHFCLHRLAQGMLPVCTSTCIGRATCFGDEADPDSLVAKVKKANLHRTLVWIKQVSDSDPAVGRVTFGGTMTDPRVCYIL